MKSKATAPHQALDVDPFAAVIATAVMQAADEWECDCVYLLCSDKSVLITQVERVVDRCADACVGTFTRQSTARDIAQAVENHWGLT